MERHRWETALRCLEIAIHPNPTDAEIVAATRGFRRTACKTPLAQLSREVAGAPVHLLSRLDQFNPTDLALHRKIDEIEAEHAAAVRDLQAAEQQAQEIGGKLLVAEPRADIARPLADFPGGLGPDFRQPARWEYRLATAARGARRNLAQTIRLFRNALNAAAQRRASVPPVAAYNCPWTAWN